MDPKASNFDPLAEKYGECVYNTSPTTPVDTSTSIPYGKVKVTFVPYANGAPFHLNENFKDNMNRNFMLSIFKFYVSNVKFVSAANKTPIKDVSLVDFDTSAPATPGVPRFFSYFEVDSIPIGDFSDIYMGFGVDPEVNEEYKNTAYPSGHPLNTTYNDMGWGWAAKYKFAVIEGRLDTDSNTIYDKSIFWHTGLSQLYRFGVIPAARLKVMKGQTTSIQLKVDVVALFSGMDIGTNQGQSHTGTPDDIISSSYIQTNLSKAVTVLGITYE